MPEEPKQAYPLNWPNGWKRTPANQRARAKFGRAGYVTQERYVGRARLTINEGTGRLYAQLDKMGESTANVILSTNLRLRKDGMPASDQREPDDPGAAVYWGSGRNQRCMAIDLYDRVADNIGALAATLDAMRAIERHGGAEILNRAFTGFAALPGGITVPRPWPEVLGVSPNASDEEIEDKFRHLAKKYHPDAGGDENRFKEISAARDQVREERRPTA
jgi:hypothetical protein